VESISTVQPNRNQHMARDSWTAGHKPELYLPMVETAEIVSKRYGIPREHMDEYGYAARSAPALPTPRHFLTIIATPATIAVVADDGRFATRDVVVSATRRLRADTTYEGVLCGAAGRHNRRGQCQPVLRRGSLRSHECA
jgi:acetyl-CoA C-acetyltransferase